MNNLSKTNSAGFTLIELMVTLAIVGIFASIAVPSFSRLMENNRIYVAGNELTSNLLLTRSEALKRSNNVTICSSTNQSTCNGGTDFSGGWIVFLDCDSNGARNTGTAAGCGPNDSEEIIKVSDGFDGTYMNNNNAGTSLTYTFAGRSASNVDIVFFVGKDSGDIRKDITINRIGRVKTEPH